MSRLDQVANPPGEIWDHSKKNAMTFLGIFVAFSLWCLASSSLFAWLESKDFGNSAYFTVINCTSVGFGDIKPETVGGKILACVNSVFGLAIVTVLLSVAALSFSQSGDAPQKKQEVREVIREVKVPYDDLITKEFEEIRRRRRVACSKILRRIKEFLLNRRENRGISTLEDELISLTKDLFDDIDTWDF